MTVEIGRELEAGGRIAAPAGGAGLARGISAVLSPPVIALASIALSTQGSDPAEAWGWALFFLVAVVAVPILYVVWLVRTGRATDFFLQRRDQRAQPYLLSLACMAAAWIVLSLGSAPPLMMALLGAALVQGLALFTVNLRWKISAHAAAIGTFAILALRVFGPAAGPCLLLVPLVAWSRIRLGRHDLAQTIAGAALGGAVLAASLSLLA